MMTWDLVADIGGTNMRVAQVVDGHLGARQDYAMVPGRDISATLADAARAIGGTPGSVVCAGAGPVKQGEISLTNGGWLVSETLIAEATGADRVRVINDFEAAAWSLASLTNDDVQPIGDTGPLTHGHRAAVGPGTGLGVGNLLWDGAAYRVIPGEGGHVGIGPRTPDEVEVFERLVGLWPDVRMGSALMVEAEAVLSGTGLPWVYQACGGVARVTGAEIFRRAEAGEPEAARCATMFQTHLAALCGDLAVTILAKGGIFLVGGVAQANAQLFNDNFWQVYQDGGRFTPLRKTCGIYLVTVRDFGLRGCANALKHAV